MLHPKQPRCISRLSRSHRKQIADRQHRQVWLIELGDQFHVPKQARVSRVVHRKSPGQTNDQSRWLARVAPHVVYIDRIRMKCMRHRHFKFVDLLRAALAHRANFIFESLIRNPETRLEYRHNLWLVLFGERQEIGGMICVRVRKENNI